MYNINRTKGKEIMLDNMFGGIIGKIERGACRLSMNGRIAVRTSDGYKTYNEKTGNLTNCSNFVLDLCDDMFMVIPTRTLNPGDIVLINGKPMYILELKAKNRVEAMSYEDSTIQTVIPERHAIMGRKFYGKIVSLMGKGFGCGKGSFFKNMLKLKMMTAMMGGSKSSDGMLGGNALPMMMLMGGGSMDGLFDGMLDDESDDEIALPFEDIDETDDEEEEVIKPKKTAKKAVKKTAKKATKKTVRK